MVKNLSDLLEESTPQEIDRLIGSEKREAFGFDLAKVKAGVYRKTGVAATAPKTAKKGRLWPKWGLFAACFVLLAVCGTAVVAEAKEYTAAIAFFQEYELSTDGLSRTDIKKVYRDITTGKFTYEKTSGVIITSVSGYDIFQEDPTPEDLENLWNYRNGDGYNMVTNHTANGISYSYESVYTMDPALGFDVLDKTIFTKRIDGKTVWSTDLYNIVIPEYAVFEDYVVIYGQTDIWSSDQKCYGRVLLLDTDGNILWNKTPDNGFQREFYEQAVCDRTGIALFGRGNLQTLCYTKLDYSGKLLQYTQTKIGSYTIKNAARLGEGYILLLSSYDVGEEKDEYIAKIDPDGSLSDSFTYSSDEQDYYITDMLEYNGNVYLSTYTVPKLNKGEGTAGGRYDIAGVLNQLFTEDGIYEIENAALTEMMRAHFTAALFVCNTQTGVPDTFYAIDGSLGADLYVNDDGNLVWNVESITDAYFSPFTSSFTIGGTCYIYRYCFDENGLLLSQEKTDEIVAFRR